MEAEIRYLSNGERRPPVAFKVDEAFALRRGETQAASTMRSRLTDRRASRATLLRATLRGKELTAFPTGERRREMYKWMIRRDRLRRETLRTWLAQAAPVSTHGRCPYT